MRDRALRWAEQEPMQGKKKGEPGRGVRDLRVGEPSDKTGVVCRTSCCRDRNRTEEKKQQVINQCHQLASSDTVRIVVGALM